jgi:hypothetical protein
MTTNIQNNVYVFTLFLLCTQFQHPLSTEFDSLRTRQSLISGTPQSPLTCLVFIHVPVSLLPPIKMHSMSTTATQPYSLQAFSKTYRWTTGCRGARGGGSDHAGCMVRSRALVIGLAYLILLLSSLRLLRCAVDSRFPVLASTMQNGGIFAPGCFCSVVTAFGSLKYCASCPVSQMPFHLLPFTLRIVHVLRYHRDARITMSNGGSLSHLRLRRNLYIMVDEHAQG